MAVLLHIDTSSSVGVAMISRDGQPVCSARSEGERDHAANINGLVEQVLQAAGLSLSDIDALAVCNGPGSYTGLRIGLATAKGYAFVLRKPLILHSRLTLMLKELAEPAGIKRNILAVLPARAGEYYAAAQGVADYFAATHITTTKLTEYIIHNREGLFLIGSVSEDLEQLITSERIPLSLHYMLDQKSWSVAAAESFESGNFADTAYSEPEYLKQAFTTQARRTVYNIKLIG